MVNSKGVYNLAIQYIAYPTVYGRKAAQWLREFAAVAAGQSLVPAGHVEYLKTIYNSSS